MSSVTPLTQPQVIMRKVSFLLLMFTLCCTGCTKSETIPRPSFEAQVIDGNIEIGYGVVSGDVDGDGLDDLLLADKKQFVWYRNGDWRRFVMIDSLTARDNVAIAARDIDGDRKVEVAVGAMWNPGETSDEAQSGSVHYLIRPEDPTQLWEAIPLPHEPTVHRMQWVRTGNTYALVVAPLHGRGNTGGEGVGVRFHAYNMPANPRDAWHLTLIDDRMHLTHNFEVAESSAQTDVYIAGKEGIRLASYREDTWPMAQAEALEGLNRSAGEVRLGKLTETPFITAIEPMHGTHLAVYIEDQAQYRRVVLDSTFAQGHALATGDLLGMGRDQIVAGWRNPNDEGKVGIKLYIPMDEDGHSWESHWIDENDMACEDLKLADLNGDGKLDIIAAGRATNNLKIYWNQTND